MKVFADKLRYEQRKFINFNKLWFPWKPVDFQLGIISEFEILVLVTTINKPRFMLVSKSAQFA